MKSLLIHQRAGWGGNGFGGTWSNRNAPTNPGCCLDLAEIYKNELVWWYEIEQRVKHTLKHRVDHLEGLVNFLADLGTSQDDLAADEDEKNNLRFDHAVNQTGEQLRFVRTEVVMARSQTLETNGELDVTRSDDVLNLEIRELGIKAKLLNDASVLAGSKLRIILRLGTSDDHFARSKDERSSLGFTNTHDDGGETLGVVLCVAGVQGNRLEIQAAIQVHRSNNVPLIAR
jgi:hypothetical protein